MEIDVTYVSPKSSSPTYASGDHVICLSQRQIITFNAGLRIDDISGGIGLTVNNPQGGICFFPHYLTAANLDPGRVRPLVDAILGHKCRASGKDPHHCVDEENIDPSNGNLKLNYVQSLFHVDDYISVTRSLSQMKLSSSSPSVYSSFLAFSTKPFRQN